MTTNENGVSLQPSVPQDNSLVIIKKLFFFCFSIYTMFLFVVGTVFVCLLVCLNFCNWNKPTQIQKITTTQIWIESVILVKTVEKLQLFCNFLWIKITVCCCITKICIYFYKHDCLWGFFCSILLDGLVITMMQRLFEQQICTTS